MAANGLPPEQGGHASPPPPPPGLFPGSPAPPAPPAHTMPAQPAVAAFPSKKPRNRIIIWVVAGVLGLCLLGSCAAVMLSGNDTETIDLAESHYSKLMSAVETASAAIPSASDDAVTRTAGLANASKALRTGRDEIAAARVAIEQLDPSDGRTTYLASLDAATEALDGLEDLVGYLGTASEMLDKIKQAGSLASQADDDLNAAIKAGNSASYAVMTRKAKAASAGFTRAAASFREAHALDSSAGLDKAAEYADARKAQAEVVVRMAGEGQAGKTAAYNKDIDRLNASAAKAEKIGEPAIISDPDWAEKRLSELSNKIETAGARADELHAKALKELGYSE